MGMGAAERVDHMGEQALGARAHVHRRRTQPEDVNADHRKTVVSLDRRHRAAVSHERARRSPADRCSAMLRMYCLQQWYGLAD